MIFKKKRIQSLENSMVKSSKNYTAITSEM